MTNRKALVLLLLLACMGLGGIAVIATKKSEPTYNGRKLSEWLDLTRFDINATQRGHAVQQIGTNALPFLLEWIQAQPSPLEFRIHSWLSSFHIDVSSGKGGLRPEAALAGFEALGETAKPAIPALVSIMDNTNIITPTWAVEALGAIGKDALPALVDLVTNSVAHKNCDKNDVAAGFQALKTNAFLAKPVMLAHVRDPNAEVSSLAIVVLATLRAVQDKMRLPTDSTADIVPALCANLDNTNTDVLCYTMRALGHFGWDARPAVPVLLQNLTSTDRRVRTAAGMALHDIDRQALEAAQKQ